MIVTTARVNSAGSRRLLDDKLVQHPPLLIVGNVEGMSRTPRERAGKLDVPRRRPGELRQRRREGVGAHVGVPEALAAPGVGRQEIDSISRHTCDVTSSAATERCARTVGSGPGKHAV